MPFRWLRFVRALVTLSAVCLPAGCVEFEPTCPFRSHCEGRRIHICENADEPYQTYKESFSDCGEGKICMPAKNAHEALECVSDPLSPCSKSGCDGDNLMVCGASGYRTGTVEDCPERGRICRETASEAACVLIEAPCPSSKSTFCSADGSMFYTGCEKGFGYAIDTVRCDSSCGGFACKYGGNGPTPGRTCRESASEAACVLAEAPCPEGKSSFCAADHSMYYEGCDKGYGYALDTFHCPSTCGFFGCQEDSKTAFCSDSFAAQVCRSNTRACSPDRSRSLLCSKTVPSAPCEVDCSANGRVCIANTGECGYEIGCYPPESSTCSADGASVYTCNTAGRYVSDMSRCPSGQTCIKTKAEDGSSSAYCQ
jgi:hypothetical protein